LKSKESNLQKGGKHSRLRMKTFKAEYKFGDIDLAICASLVKAASNRPFTYPQFPQGSLKALIGCKQMDG
jgi:hypothetical protein